MKHVLNKIYIFAVIMLLALAVSCSTSQSAIQNLQLLSYNE
jgi:hypothetical protein